MEDVKRKFQLFDILAKSPDIDLRTIVQKFGFSLKTLKSWKTEYLKDLESTIVVDETVDKPIKVTKSLIENIPDPEPLEIDEITGEVVESSELKKRTEQRKIVEDAKQVKANIYKAKVTSLKDLQESVIAAASNIIELANNRIIELDVAGNIIVNGDGTTFTPYNKDLAELTSVITDIQNTFFNRNGVSIIPPSSGNKLLENFRKNLKA